jgi:hypothetical protein
MLPYRDSRITRIVLVVFFALVASYAYYEGSGIIWGPAIEIENRVMQVDEPFIAIEGNVRRVAALSMNGKSIALTENGTFSEGYVLAPGYNRITLSARDRFGKSTERAIEILYTPSEKPEEPSASTTTQIEL